MQELVQAKLGNLDFIIPNILAAVELWHMLVRGQPDILKRHLLLTIVRPTRIMQPHAAPAPTSPQPMHSTSPLSRADFPQRKHPARNRRASFPPLERAFSEKTTIGRDYGMAGNQAGERAGGQGERAGGVGVGGGGGAERASGRARVRAERGDERGRDEERAGGRLGAWASGRVGWGEGEQWSKRACGRVGG